MDGWFIYAPLTNPELVFTYEEYTKKIMTIFKPASQFRIPVQVTMTTELREKYHAISSELRKALPTDVQRLNPAELMENMNINGSLARHGITLSQGRVLLETACKELQLKYGTVYPMDIDATEAGPAAMPRK